MNKSKAVQELKSFKTLDSNRLQRIFSNRLDNGEK